MNRSPRLKNGTNRDPTTRRRAAQACATCRSRKVRCDAGIPKCGLCVSLDVECAYLNPETTRLDPNTRLLLDRIQHLEDRIFPPHPPAGIQPTTQLSANKSSPLPSIQTLEDSHSRSFRPGVNVDGLAQSDALTLPVLHNGKSNNVYHWNVVQSLLSQSEDALTHIGDGSLDLPDATDVLLLSDIGEPATAEVNSWHIFDEMTIDHTSQGQFQELDDYNSRLEHHCKDLVQEYFTNVHVFYPILSKAELFENLRRVAELEKYGRTHQAEVSISKYCLLLMVLCLGSSARSEEFLLFSDAHHANTNSTGISRSVTSSDEAFASFNSTLWPKAKLLLGIVSMENSIEAAQCFALSSVYLGAKGSTLESEYQIHMAARKVGILTKRTFLQTQGTPKFSDSFCRLFWVVYVYESDFAMELSMTPPSGITQFEELVPYPSSENAVINADTHMHMGASSPYDMQDDSTSSPKSPHLDLAAFQISTNSAIRRFLNRITAVVYNPAETWRKQNTANYTSWLLNMTNELQSHHEAIHGNLPSFLLSTDPAVFWYNGSASTPRDARKFSNHLWNVSRLRGRYCAGQYLITRASFELLLLNPEVVEAHRSGTAIMEKCMTCIKSCIDFIKIFSIEPVNCITNVFVTGMATFAMVIILMISTTSISFQRMLPPDIDSYIWMGQRNLERFSKSVVGFEWHLRELKRLDQARKSYRKER